MGLDFSKTKFIVSDQEYQGLENLPEQYRKYLEDIDKDGIPDAVGNHPFGWLLTKLLSLGTIAPEEIKLHSSQFEIKLSDGQTLSSQNKEDLAKVVKKIGDLATNSTAQSQAETSPAKTTSVSAIGGWKPEASQVLKEYRSKHNPGVKKNYRWREAILLLLVITVVTFFFVFTKLSAITG